VQLGVIQSQSSDLQATTEALIENLQRGNAQIQRQNNGYIRENIGGRNGLTSTLRNVSEVTGGAESVTVSTVSFARWQRPVCDCRRPARGVQSVSADVSSHETVAAD
jgi:hypothetical protein